MSARAQDAREPRWPALLPVGYALSVTLYVLMRYGGRWSEQDTGQIVTSIRAVMAQGTIAPANGAYPHGFAYQAIAAFTAEVTGLSVTTVDLMILPFLSLAAALAAFIAFRALTGSGIAGAFAGLLLFIQPEFVFVLERGSHEKVTHTLVLLLMFLLAFGLRGQADTAALIGSILAFYLVAWALISTNSFFGSSFIASLTLAVASMLLLLRLISSSRSERAQARRLTYTVASCFALFFMFVAYIYAPARYNYETLHTLIDKVSALLLSFEIQSNPYQSLGGSPGAAWAAPWVYPILFSFNAVVILGAGAVWLWLAREFLRHGVRSAGRSLVLLWLMTAAFALEVVVSAAVDVTGFLGSNLQIRLFPLFMLAGIPLFVYGLLALRRRYRWPRRSPIFVLVGLALAFFATTGILKATSDPLVSNKWLFFSSGERAALQWTDQSLQHRTVWEGFDERLLEMQILYGPGTSGGGNSYAIGVANEDAQYAVLSSIISARSVRLQLPAPDVTNDDLVYANGNAEVFHQVPQTPYQP